MRAVIFANGEFNPPFRPRPDDLLIAADGGLQHCRNLGLTPAVVIGDFDSLSESELAGLEMAGVKLLRYPARKDQTDLELALHYAQDLQAEEILVLASLGARWDQTLANLLLPATASLASTRIHLVDGHQQIFHIRPGAATEVRGSPGDTVSLIPLSGDASGITTLGLEYPLEEGTLFFGSTRGVSNVLLGETASVNVREGVLLCVVIHSVN